jgi:hypothetical protein
MSKKNKSFQIPYSLKEKIYLGKNKESFKDINGTKNNKFRTLRTV